ncbi:LysM peptidoglycan-binding domain-containing protein [Endothiovibrio diazotrophicus]
MSIKPLLGALVGALLCAVGAAAAAESVQLAADHPTRYTVVPGDTLWDIAGRFLRDPWRWKEVWSGNPQIRNPHWIYPGDVIHLVYDGDGQPRLRLERGMRVVKLSPRVRVSDVDGAIPTIRAEVIRHFFTRTRAVPEGALLGAPYVVSAADEHMIIGAGDLFHARELGEPYPLYAIVRPGKLYTEGDAPVADNLDQVTGGAEWLFNPAGERAGVLGQEAVHVGEAQLVEDGEPATLRVLRSTREVQVGDRLIPADDSQIERNMYPVAPVVEVAGRIIDVVDGLTQIGQYNAIVIDRGSRHGMQVGDVVAVYQRGRTVRDPYAGGFQDAEVKLPDQRAALALLFQTYDRISYALVMEAERAIHVGDMVRNP